MNWSSSSQVILITGTPGVGKSSIGFLLNKKGFQVLNLNKLIIDNGFYFGYDFSRDTVIIDEEKLQLYLRDLLVSNSTIIFIEGHTLNSIPEEFLELIFIINCNPAILRKRLELSRDYSKEKTEENIQAEIFDECKISIKETFPSIPVIELDSSFLSAEELVEKILSILHDKKNMF
ncbi:MAG TPA: adenylate kinase family protein [candidate division Zixibacteria bacterium]|nr:adenylate kinase family protein [candidate division Zixibacteria bacterium]